jgi:hypothetical protein
MSALSRRQFGHLSAAIALQSVWKGLMGEQGLLAGGPIPAVVLDGQLLAVSPDGRKMFLFLHAPSGDV